ncbi:MAG: hypothetical protein RR959_05995 [Erysipelotrichaceae bacterium]
MALWAEATIACKHPKRVNFMGIVNRSLKDKYGDMGETIVTSVYSKEDRVVLSLRTVHIGDLFNDMIEQIIKGLKQANVGFFHVEIHRNHFLS